MPNGVVWAKSVYRPPKVESGLNYFLPPGTDIDLIQFDEGSRWSYSGNALARGYYANDQRIEWSGQEATFGTEGIVAGSVQHQSNAWEVGATAELFLNQPFDRNILIDTPTRQSFAPNFEIETLEIQQLFVSARRGDLYLALGKFNTPFGRTYFPLYANDYHDAPFLRSDVIHWRETGFLVQWDPHDWIFTAAVVNGSTDRDTNSSKGIVARAGYQLPWLAVGASIKQHDGVGSEHQKVFNNHVGIDAMFRLGNWTFSGEAVYDEFGLRRDDLALTDITWGRSIYHRELNKSLHDPTTGFGYYLDVEYRAEHFTLMFNYGEFYPEELGDPIHDAVTRRGIVKGIYHFHQHFSAYAMLLVENNMDIGQEGRERKGTAVLTGFQLAL